MLLPREVCSGGLNVMGHEFAEGTVIGVPTYVLHHNELYFDCPFKYDPSRWLVKGKGEDTAEGNSPEIIARQRQAFIPFSLGPRGCIGRNVALFELYISIARVLFLYDLRMQPGTEHLGIGPFGEYKIRDYFIVGKEGPVLQFRPRQPKTA
jgi:cytochrome P450